MFAIVPTRLHLHIKTFAYSELNLTFLQVQQRHISPPGALLQVFPYKSSPMAPSAITPPHGVQQTPELTAAAVTEKIAQTAPGLLKK